MKTILHGFEKNPQGMRKLLVLFEAREIVVIVVLIVVILLVVPVVLRWMRFQSKY